MEVPTVEEAREASAYLDSLFPAPEGTPALEDWIAAAAGLVASLTGRSIGPEAPGEDVPAWLLPLAKRAIVLKVEGLVNSLGGTFSERRSKIGEARLAGFSAGAYSETYFGPDVVSKSGMLDPDQTTADILWALATEEKRNEWLLKWQGIEQPAAMVQSFEWGQGPGGY